MCKGAGIKLEYLPPYSPDFNPIEEAFAELKACIRRNQTWLSNRSNRTRTEPHVFEPNRPKVQFGSKTTKARFGSI